MEDDMAYLMEKGFARKSLNGYQFSRRGLSVGIYDMGLWNIGIIDTNNGGYLVYNRFEVGTLRNNYDSIVKSLCLKVLKKAQEYVMLVEDVRSEI